MGTIKALCDSCKAAETALLNIGHVWSELGKELEALRTRLTDGQSKIETSEYESILADLSKVDEQWLEIVKTANILADIEIFEDEKNYHMSV